MMIVAVLLLAELTLGRIYDRCELARELKYVHQAPPHQVATWVCIAEHESQYNTSIVGHLNGDGSGDHGIFQISDKFWCSPPNKGYACGLTCAELEDDDITDDFICAQRIYKEHKQISGDGFNAWAVYQPHCKGPKADRYVKDCFNDLGTPTTPTTPTSIFAHGFFDAAVGRTTPKPFFRPSVQNTIFTTKKPELRSFFGNNRFFTSTQTPIDLFFTPTTPSTLKPIFTTRDLIIYNPTISTPVGSLGSTVSRSFEFGNTYSPPSTKLLFTPTITTPTYHTSTYPAPVFIINGVKWY